VSRRGIERIYLERGKNVYYMKIDERGPMEIVIKKIENCGVYRKCVDVIVSENMNCYVWIPAMLLNALLYPYKSRSYGNIWDREEPFRIRYGYTKLLNRKSKRLWICLDDLPYIALSTLRDWRRLDFVLNQLRIAMMIILLVNNIKQDAAATIVKNIFDNIVIPWLLRYRQ